MVRDFMQKKDTYVLQDRYIAEFMEKYERLNLEGYNSGGYAYRESKKIFNRAQEESKGQHRSNLKDVSSLQESIKVNLSTMNTQDIQGRRLTLFDKLKKTVGIRVAEETDPDL